MALIDASDPRTGCDAMGTIRAKFLSTLSMVLESREVILDGLQQPLRQVLESMKQAGNGEFARRILGEQDMLNKYVLVLVNGKDMRAMDGLETVVHDGDVLTFVPSIAGG